MSAGAVKEGGIRAQLGSRLAARFAGLGLTQEVPELRGEQARPAASLCTPEPATGQERRRDEPGT
jgi:hypothetical protein